MAFKLDFYVGIGDTSDTDLILHARDEVMEIEHWFTLTGVMDVLEKELARFKYLRLHKPPERERCNACGQLHVLNWRALCTRCHQTDVDSATWVRSEASLEDVERALNAGSGKFILAEDGVLMERSDA